MDTAAIFEWVNSLALLGWALMIFTPKWIYTQKSIRLLILPAILAVLYVVLILSADQWTIPDVSSPVEIRRIFSSDLLLLAGWVHYLAFDLLVGSWILLKAQAAGLRHLMVVPALFLTFIFGPLGLLFFLIVYLAKKKSWPTL